MNWRKFFVIIGVPLLVFYLFLINIYFAFISGVLLISLLIGLISLKKDHLWERLSKLSISLTILFVILVSNPIIWPDQFSRHISHERIITPNHPSVTGLNDTSELWTWMNDEKGLSISQFEALEDSEKLPLIEEYFLDIIEWIEIHYQYGVFKRVATPEEAITSGYGDCQAQTCAMVSFLIYMGYNAYAAETPLHWYAVVYLEDGTPVYLYRIIDDGFRCSDPEVLINHEEVLYTMKTPQLLWDIIIDDHMNENMFFPAVQQLGSFFGFLLSFGVLGIIIAISEARINKIEWKNLFKDMRDPILITGGSMMIGVIIARLLPMLIPKAFVGILLFTLIFSTKLSQILFRKRSKQEKIITN